MVSALVPTDTLIPCYNLVCTKAMRIENRGAVAMADEKPTEFKVTKFTGELPAVNGKVRIPSPFDAVVADSFKSGETMLVQCKQDDKVRGQVVAQLHKAAKFAGCGLDLWRTLPEGIAFKARPKRDIKPATDAAAA